MIIFVPGMKPKPEPGQHRAALLRCLLASLHRVDRRVAAALEADDSVFVRANWTYAFYQRYRDIGLDADGIDQLIADPAPSETDLQQIDSWQRRLTLWLYKLADRWPAVAHRTAQPAMRETLGEIERYRSNLDSAGDRSRADLIRHLRAAAAASRPVLVIGHSFGSVITWDALQSLSADGVGIDTFMTIGSPLGNRMIQEGLIGWQSGRRYPDNIDHWVNVMSRGELVVLRGNFKQRFAPMLAGGHLETITDRHIVSHFHDACGLNVHSEYGYLSNDQLASDVAAWWRRCRDY
ncbi:MAG: alpha/beta hydrolase [Pseudomonadota bacterium]